MYIADLFNNNNLLQHFGGYVKKQRNVNSDEFLFHATTLVMGIYKIKALNAFCLRQMQTTKEHLTVRDERIIVWSPTMIELLTLIPLSFSSMIVMQNKIFPLLQSALGLNQSLPSSFRDGVKSIHKYNLPKSVMQKTLSYWQHDGLAVRQYRDIAEHHYNLLARCYYQFAPVEKVLIYLPDDPNQKNHAKFTFEKKIDCIEYVEQAFLNLCQYVEAILADLGFAEEPIQQTINETQIDLEDGVQKTLGVVFSDTDGNIGMEFGQTEERRLYFKLFNWSAQTTSPI